MIKKVINYCWFGGNPLSDTIIKNIDSWKKYCPEYKIIQWNENNFDVSKYLFTQEAYDKKKWAFVSDVARLDIIYHNGGIYLDTDVELISSLDSVLQNNCFLAREDKYSIGTGLGFGAEIQNKFILENLQEYKNKHFINSDGTLNQILCVDVTTNLLATHGFKPSNNVEVNNGITIYPRDYFCPIRIGSGKIVINENTLSIHHYDASWKIENNASWKQRFIPVKKVLKYYIDTFCGYGTYNSLKRYIK